MRRTAQQLEDENDRLALIGIRATLLSLGSADPGRLVARKMAMIVAKLPGLAKDGIYACYVSEPVTALAALIEMQDGKTAEILLKTVLSLLRSRGASTIFASGDANTFVASALLLLARDHTGRTLLGSSHHPIHMGVPLPIVEYMCALFGKDALQHGTEAERFLAGCHISAIQMIVASGAITRERISTALQRYCALVCDKDESVFDAILPMTLPLIGERQMELLTAKDMSGLFVKVVHWREDALSSAKIDAILATMDGAADAIVQGVKYTLLLIIVGEREECNESWNNGKVSRQDGKRLQLVLSEVSAKTSPCLTEAMAASLRGIARHGEVTPVIR